MVEFNEMIYDYVNPNHSPKYYELHVDTPGYIYMDTNACLADIKVYYEDEDLDSEKFKAAYPNENTKFGKVIKISKAGPVFFKVVKPQLQRDPQDNVNNKYEESYTSVYSLEFYYKRHYDSYPFKGVFPGNSGKIDFELGANPIVNFEPVVIREDLLEKYNYHLIYHLVMSPSEKEVNFRAGCDRLFEFLMPESYRAEVIELTKDTNTNERGNFIVGKTDGDQGNGQEDLNWKKIDGAGYSHQGEKEDEGKLGDLEKKAEAKKTARAMRDHAKGKDKVKDKKVAPKSDTGTRRVLAESQTALAPFAKPVAKPDAPRPLHLTQQLLNLVPTDTTGLQLKINSLISSCCTFNPKLRSGTVYYGKVYATLYASPKDSSVGAWTTHYIRIKYDEFSLRTPFLMLPFEYLFVGLVLLAIICSVCAIGKRYIKKLMSRVTGFRQVSGDEELDIDAKLEDYFMNNRGKFEEQFEEYKTYSVSEEVPQKKDGPSKASQEIKNVQKNVGQKSGVEVKSPTKEIELRTKTPVKTPVKKSEKTEKSEKSGQNPQLTPQKEVTKELV
jgi:hypothetical protein